MYFASGVVQLTLMKRILNLVKEQRVSQVLCGPSVQTEVLGSKFLCLMLCAFPWANVRARTEVTTGGVVIEKCSASTPNAQTVLKIRKLWKKNKKQKNNQPWEFYFFLWLKQKGLETKGVMTVEPGVCLARSWVFARHIFGWGVCHCFIQHISAMTWLS